jgi:Predicted membrane protein
VDAGIFLAALGITLLEMVEAASVALALYVASGRALAFLFVTLGVLVVIIPTFFVGRLIALLPTFAVRLVAATLLLYFGLKLSKSARKSVLRSRNKAAQKEEFEKGALSTGFSVGAVEALECAIVLLALIPNSYDSALYGFFTGIVVVVVFTYLLKSHVRRIKQANMKVVVAALLLSFSAFWYAETLLPVNDLVLPPLFALFAAGIYFYANGGNYEIINSQ